MVVGEANIHNIMGGMESTGGVRLHNHKRKLKQRFDIIRKLGQGTYGKVQLGINKETGQEVAIKTIKKCKIETEADLIRIRREIQIMSSVQHPNIIHIYEVFENREKMVLVMEYAAGGELYDYLSERKVLTEHEARRIFRQIATAVFYCHKHKICHRDLKLENILLDQIGNAKIADFGLSNVFDEQRLLNTFCGSPLYASPEIVKGTPYHGPEVDCWSLGVLLYTLVYGAMPFDGSNFKQLVKQISQSDYFEPEKPSPASPLIKDMLTVCPGRRADIERICTHWWVNEGYEQNCLDIAEDLAAQTPVRLDLLLSLVPQSASAEKLVVGDQQDVANNMSSETLVPTRCHSVGSLMELDQNERRIREMCEEEPRDAKRKLETTPSMEEAAGAKRKERSRRKEKEDKEPKTYKPVSRHHSAPIPNAITEETMEVDPGASVPTGKSVDLNKVIEAMAACLELIEESKEGSPSKEHGKTPPVEPELNAEVSPQNATKDVEQRPTTQERVQSDKPAATKSSDVTKTANKVVNEAVADKQVDSKSELAEIETSASQDINLEATQREFKKLKEKALSLDSELASETREPAKTFERRRSKIFETAEKFNQMTSNTDSEKPKKIFIPGVNVGGAKRVFERKASLSSITPPTAKTSTSKVIIDVPADRKSEKPKSEEADEKKRDDAKKRAVDIISGAIGKPPVQRKVNGSPPTSPPSHDPKKLPLKIPVAPNDVRTATVSVSTPVETKFPFDAKPADQETVAASRESVSEPQSTSAQQDEPKMSSKMEITLKSATLPRRKTSKAEISLSGVKSPEPAFKSEVEAKIDAFQPLKLRTQRSEIAFPVASSIRQANRSSSLEPEGRPKSTVPKERIIPIQVESDHAHSSTPPPKPPMPQRSISQRSGSLSRQSTADSDTDSALGSTVGPEPIRKSPREYIIPIAVEGGGYVTPRSGSLEPESKTSTPTSTNPPRSRFGRPRRMSSLLSDASEDESPFSALHRDSEDLLQRHMHRLRSSRPSRQPPEHADSLSSGEDDDDDGFELLTAENLFSTLLSRVRSLTQRLNVDDNRGAGFPSSRLFGRLGSNSPQAFWGLNKPLSRRLTESQFRHSLSREGDIFSRKDSVNSSNPGTPNSPSRSTPSRESVFDIGSNTLPRDTIEHEDIGADPQLRKEELEHNFTPSLARRLSRTFIEQTRQSLPRSPSVPYEKYYRSPSVDAFDADRCISDQTEYKDTSDRHIRRSNSLLEPGIRHRRQARISLFEDEDKLPYPRQIMTLGRKYKEAAKSGRRDNFHSYKTEKIQEEGGEDDAWRENVDGNETVDNGSVSECTSTSMCNSNTNLLDTSSVSAKSYETSPTESSSNIIDYKAYKSDLSKTFENRLLAAENLIKESKLRNLGPKFDPNLRSSYRDTDKCDKESLVSISDPSCSSVNRRSCIPSLRLRSGSLTRESSLSADRRKSFSGSDRGVSPEKSLLSKFFRPTSKDKDTESKDKKPKHRISRFLRPDFFDTPREESKYVKEKEAQRAAENERRKSRFIKRKTEKETEEKREKELKNEINSLKREQADNPEEEKSKNEVTENQAKIERQSSRSSFLHTLEKKLEKLRSNTDEETKPVVSNGIERSVQTLRENSAPPAESSQTEGKSLKKAISVENLSTKSSQSSKSRVSSVLGLFKNETKQTANGRPQNMFLSRLKRSPPKATKCEQSPSDDLPSTSKIPTKFAVKNDSKLSKKVNETKKPEKIETKTSPLKEESKKSLSIVKDKKPSEKPRETKKVERTQEASTSRRRIDKTDSLGKVEGKSSSEEPMDKPEKAMDGDIREESSFAEDKKLLKTKANSSLMKSGSCAESKKEETERKVKKVIKTKESAEKDDAEGTKKKKIVRVVKKIVKKSSDSSDSKSDDKAKSTKVQIKKKPVAKTEKSPEPVAPIPKQKGKENDSTAITRSSLRTSRSVETTEQNGKLKSTSESGSSKTSAKADQIKLDEAITADTKNGQTKLERPNRSSLKLDLSKIPQHSFRNTTPKKESPPKLDSPKVEDEEKLMECLSKMTHRASITGNKIVIDKPLRAKDVADLKRELTECARIIESHADANNESSVPQSIAPPEDPPKTKEQLVEAVEPSQEPESKEPTEYTDLFSPDEPESFDSWSLSSVDLNHTRPDLHSPTSPSHIFSRSDNESVIDRIRRRSFYSRFNDRKRPSVGTLPRKLSLSNYRERKDYGNYAVQRDRSYLEPVTRRRERYSENSPYITDFRSPEVPSLSSSYDPLRRRYLRSPTLDLSSSRSRYHSVDFTDTDLAYRSPLSTLLTDNVDHEHSSTLPRKYGSTAEPKTVEYYEELLAPTNTDYLPRRSPLPNEYLNRCENGYHNGSLDLHLNRRKYVDRGSDLEGEELERRNRNERTSETRNLPSTSADVAATYTAD